eukprot:gene16340-32470_t
MSNTSVRQTLHESYGEAPDRSHELPPRLSAGQTVEVDDGPPLKKSKTSKEYAAEPHRLATSQYSISDAVAGFKGAATTTTLPAHTESVASAAAATGVEGGMVQGIPFGKGQSPESPIKYIGEVMAAASLDPAQQSHTASEHIKNVSAAQAAMRPAGMATRHARAGLAWSVEARVEGRARGPAEYDQLSKTTGTYNDGSSLTLGGEGEQL